MLEFVRVSCSQTHTCVPEACVDSIEKNVDTSTVSTDAVAMLEGLASGHSAPSGASQDHSLEAASTTTASSQGHNIMETVEEMKSLHFQVRKMGYSENVIVSLKENDELTFFRIQSITDTTVKLVQCVDGHDGAENELDLKDLTSTYKIYKGKITELLQGWDIAKHNPLSSTTWSCEASKSAVVLAMQITYRKYKDHAAVLELLQHPTTVKVTKAFKSHELHLPAASMKVERKDGKGFLQVGLDLRVAPQFSPPLDPNGGENKAPWIVPFWLVGASSDDEPANMQLRHQNVDVMGWKVHIPVLENKVALKVGDVLRWDKKDVFDQKFDKKKAATAPSAAASSGPPKKKGRKE